MLTLMIQFRYGSMHLATSEESFTELTIDLVKERTNARTTEGEKERTDGRTDGRTNER